VTNPEHFKSELSSETENKPQALFDLLEKSAGEMTSALDEEALVDG
jgi:hypothetical protein